MRTLKLATLIGLLAVVGCSTLQKGDAMVKYQPGDPPMQTLAPMDGSYALYDSSDLSPKVTVNLREGEPLGFRMDGEAVVAIAGANTYSLGDQTSTHYWRRR